MDYIKKNIKISIIHTKTYVLYLFISVAVASVTQMRVVKETANYGYFAQNVADTDNVQTSPKVPPSNFSGPLLLKRLIGKCYNLTQEQYRYTFCPFQNFTQYEVSQRWNAYHGVLGVWDHWNIENNLFRSMIYNHGDQCGNIERSVEVQLLCGNNETLLNVTEPAKCQYFALFSTRYVCHNDSLLVYPRLSHELQKQWDDLLTDFHHKYITEKGYDAGLKVLFESAGFLTKRIAEIKETTTVIPPSLIGSAFTDLSLCNEEYQSLQREISRLNNEIDSIKLLLDLSKLENRTSKPKR